uniref:ATP-binding cassette G family transporter ABCG96 n=1 Tax=Toxoplasma gondii COUG TaxID=1074873 RepID=A0A2G8Y416_TOXGO|nr:ATP-binding cassette G family transporter ABCG96 [Toxoplasma gondii COUG]
MAAATLDEPEEAPGLACASEVWPPVVNTRATRAQHSALPPRPARSSTHASLSSAGSHGDTASGEGRSSTTTVGADDGEVGQLRVETPTDAANDAKCSGILAKAANAFSAKWYGEVTLGQVCRQTRRLEGETWLPRSEFACVVGEGDAPRGSVQEAKNSREAKSMDVGPRVGEGGFGDGDDPNEDGAWASLYRRPFGACTVVVRDICFTLPRKRESTRCSFLRRCASALCSLICFSKDLLTVPLQQLVVGESQQERRSSQYAWGRPASACRPASEMDASSSEATRMRSSRLAAEESEKDSGRSGREAAEGDAGRGHPAEEPEADTRMQTSESGRDERGSSNFGGGRGGDGPAAPEQWREDEAAKDKQEADEHRPEERQLVLHPFSAVFEAGTMTAVMGPSGCGKTTLLNVVAHRTQARQTGGQVFVNGKPRGRSFKRLVAFVQQDDIFDGKETVRECLEFSRDLRMNFSSIPDSTERQRAADAYTDQALRVLGLQAVADSPIGNEAVRGVSGGQKRRVTLGLGLMSDAQIFLCDEPTTGLSAADALAVVRTLRRLCDVYTVTVVAVIHQPSMQILSLFDNLILLSCEGRCAYNGKVADCQAWFENCGFPFPLHQNPADYLSDLVSPHKGHPAQLAAFYEAHQFPAVQARVTEALRGAQTPSGGRRDSARADADENMPPDGAQASSFAALDLHSEATGGSPSSSEAGGEDAPHIASLWKQLSMIGRRSARLWLRDRGTLAAIYCDAAVEGVILGLVMARVRQTQPPYYQLSALFLLVYCVCASALWTIPLFVQQKAQLIMEVTGGYYSALPHYVATTSVSACVVGGSDVVLFSILWFLAGFEWTALPFSLFVSLLAFLVVDGAFYLASIASSSFAHANSVTAVAFMLFTFVNGFTTNPQSMPLYVGWVSYLCPFFLAFEATAVHVMKAYPFADQQASGRGRTLPMGEPTLASAEELFKQYGLAGRVYGVTMDPGTYVWLVDVLILVLLAVAVKGSAAVFQSVWVAPNTESTWRRTRLRGVNKQAKTNEEEAGEIEPRKSKLRARGRG